MKSIVPCFNLNGEIQFANILGFKPSYYTAYICII